MWDPGSKIWDQDLVKNFRHQDAKSSQNKILTEIWRLGQNFLRPMCFEDYNIISILYPYNYYLEQRKQTCLFIYKIIKPPSKAIFRPRIIMTYCTCYAYNIINRYYCTVSWILKLWDKKFMNSNNKETWGGILCCLMNWTKGSGQMLQWGN